MQRKGLKKAKTAIYQALERVRDVGAAGSNPVIPTKNAVDTVVSLHFFFFEKDLNLKNARAVKKAVTKMSQLFNYMHIPSIAAPTIPASF